MEEMAPEVQAEDSQGEISNMGSLDLRHLKGPEAFARIKEISNVGVILVYEDQVGNLARVPISNVGTILPVPTGPNVKLMSGQLELSGESLAAQSEDTVLVLAGMVMITSPVETLRCQLVVAGQLLAPKVSEPLIASKLLSATGQVVFYRGTSVRTMVGDNTLTADFLDMVETPVTLLLVGDTRFAKDITVQMLKQKIEDLVLIGDVDAPVHLHGAIQFLASQVLGDMMDRDGTDDAK